MNSSGIYFPKLEVLVSRGLTSHISPKLPLRAGFLASGSQILVYVNPPPPPEEPADVLQYVYFIDTLNISYVFSRPACWS